MSCILSGNTIWYRHIGMHVTLWVAIQTYLFYCQFVPPLATGSSFMLASAPFQHVPIFWIPLLFSGIT